EDGIRDKLVTGVQTCALPILGDRQPILGPRIPHFRDCTHRHSLLTRLPTHHWSMWCSEMPGTARHLARTDCPNGGEVTSAADARSEERRGGKGCCCGGGRMGA